MVNGINGITGTNYQPYQNQASNESITRKSDIFGESDEAIISAQAKLMNALERFNNGEGDIIDLAVTSITSEIEVAANAHVINAQKHMMDKFIDLI